MRVNLNLLPDEKKGDIEKKKRLRIIFYQGFLLFSICAFFLIIMININIILKMQLQSIDDLASREQSRSAIIEIKEYETKFKDTNVRLALLSQIEKNSVNWSKLFTKLSQLTPDNVSLISLSTKDFSVMLLGKARTRDELILFKDNLSNESCFFDVNVPLSNLVVKDNLDFAIDLKIKKECLRDE